MRAYLINLDTTKALAAFPSMAEAVAVGTAGDYAFTIATDAGDIESQLKRDEMTTIYNQVTGADLKKFANKVEGAARTFEAMEQYPFEPVVQEKVATAPKRSTGAVAQVWAIADELHVKGGATRASLLAAAGEAGINLNTAKTQWQKWRQANLQIPLPKA